MVWKVPQRLNSAMITREKNSFIVPRWKVSAVLFLAERHSSNRNVLVNPRWCKWVGSASAEGSRLSQRAISDLERYMSRHRIRLITSGFKYYFFRYIVWQFFLLTRRLRGGGYKVVLRGRNQRAPWNVLKQRESQIWWVLGYWAIVRRYEDWENIIRLCVSRAALPGLR